MRHGKPALSATEKVSSRQMPDWIASYDLADTGSDLPPGPGSMLAGKARVIISSDLPRAVSSLRALGCEPMFTHSVFREAELPVYHIPAVRLSAFCWAAIFRLVWLCGIAGKVESLSMAKKRARQSAEILINLASEDNGPVLLMGHGIMNRLIARELMRCGWRKQRRHGKGYWQAGVYQR